VKPSQKALRLSVRMHGEQNRRQQQDEGDAEDAAVPGVGGLPQGGYGDGDQNDEPEQTGDGKSRASHGS
jgi:hypothetical protein